MPIPVRTAVVTGGNAGIGRAIALKLAGDGIHVAICGRTAATLEETAEAIRSAGGSVFNEVCDAGDASSVDAFVSRAAGSLGSIDALVNNAGASGKTPLNGRRDDELWRQIVRTNLDGPYFFTASSLPHVPDGGRIVNISSILGRFGVPGYAAYCASKHGVIGFTRAAALELAARRITVNAICPGWVETAMARAGLEAGASESGTSYEEYREAALAQVPLGAMIQPSEIAELVAFLLSPAAANITGQAYNIDGGQTMD